jgi:hypothetical protein
VNSSPPLSDAELSEVLKLRNEIGQLRRTLKEMDQLHREIDRIRNAAQRLTKDQDRGGDGPTALLADQMELRRARLGGLRQWLGDRPEEQIPELQFLSEESWIRSADWERVTDEEFRGWISAQRSNAEAKFARMTQKALKGFAQEHDSRFPTDVSQLKGYYEMPIDDAILQRWEVVPAKSLIKSLAEGGGDWVITQKTPVNKKFDSRRGISLTDCRGTLQEGRWETVR